MQMNYRALLILLFLAFGLYAAPASAAKESGSAGWNEKSLAMRRLAATNEIFQKYGAQYHFDGLFLAAVGWQESKLDPRARSAAGYVGMMQIMPSTARQMGIRDPQPADANVHAAAKYMDALMRQYFRGTHLSNENRRHFALACYNAGCHAVAQYRREAKARGYNPNIWSGNVERVANAHTVKYVRSVEGYYAAFRQALVRESRQHQHD
ncbi:MAG: transglycosylase SLT domain-containing protein [Alphaproteobacteria bacterium]